MNEAALRLKSLIVERGEDRAALSRLIGRNAAYIQQFIERGTPKRLAEDDRRTLAQYFGISETELGATTIAPARSPLVNVPRLAVGASAGPGAVGDDEAARCYIGFDAQWLRRNATSLDTVSIIQVQGDSMVPTLRPGDDILVDRGDAAAQLRAGIYVLRIDDTLLVKRIAIGEHGVTVSSDNPDYPDQGLLDPQTISVIGRVIWSGGKVG